jgi:hypothetical protein
MAAPPEAEVLRVFVGALDKHGHRPLHEVIVEKARERGLAGATVFRGVTGSGASGHLHTAKVLGLSEDSPVVVEIIDKPERIEAFLPDLEVMVKGGLITLQKVRTTAYGHHGTKETDPGPAL